MLEVASKKLVLKKQSAFGLQEKYTGIKATFCHTATASSAP